MLTDTCVVPEYFQVELDEIQACVDHVKIGEVICIATAAGGHPVYAVAYGDKIEQAATTNFSGYCGGGQPGSYVNEDRKQVVFLIGGCHG
ncbi:MAG: hypothetical protein HRU15_11895, partial [Planctomycetes bacterium]|nr:hypothetical protein [Planctomycetota bacterium]